MKEKMNIVSPRNSKDGQTIWHTIGTAFKNEKTGGWDLLFNSLPLPEMNDKGQLVTRAMLLKPRENNNPQPSPHTQRFSDGMDY
jgi:hypothetical protein